MSAPFRDHRSVKQYQKRGKNKNSVKTSCCFLVRFLHLFSLSIIITHSAAVFRHCLPPPRSYISTIHSLSHIFFFSSAKTLLRSLPSSLSPSLFFFIPRSSSPVIHPGQTTIPYKASGSPHLASYFHIRSFSKGQGLYRIKPGM